MYYHTEYAGVWNEPFSTEICARRLVEWRCVERGWHGSKRARGFIVVADGGHFGPRTTPGVAELAIAGARPILSVLAGSRRFRGSFHRQHARRRDARRPHQAGRGWKFRLP